MDEPTNGELAVMLTGLRDQNASEHKGILAKMSEVETQTKKTNGSVADLNRWRYMTVGAVAVVVVVLGWVVQITIKKI